MIFSKLTTPFFLLLGLCVLGSCAKKHGDSELENQQSLKVPSDFSWETSRNVKFNIGINDDRFGNASHAVEIYSGDPFEGGKVLSKGSASVDQSFQTTLYLADTLKEVYVLQTSPDLSNVYEKVSLNSTNISVLLDGYTDVETKSVSAKRGTSSTSAITETSPDCNTGCTRTVSSSNTNLSVNNGEVLCITGSNITVGFNAGGGTIRICGSNVTVQNANLNGSAKLIITSTGSARFSNLNLNGSNAKFQNFGTTAISGSFSPNGRFENAGIFSTTGDLNLNSGSYFENDGTITVGANMNLSNPVSFNNGSLTVTGDFQINNKTIFTNKCTFWVKGDCKINSVLNNYKLLKVSDETVINGNSDLNLYNNAMVTTASMSVNGRITGSGLTSLIKVAGNSTINGGGKIKGTVQYCDANGIETNHGSFSNGASLGCGVYIPKGSCNSEGNGAPAIVDADNDGVADNLDEYPLDARRAYNNFYPSGTAADRGSVAFEDSWPQKGDYDLNDLVVSYRYKVVTNGRNEVVQLEGDYTLYATGGTSGNGFAVAFPVKRENVRNFVGGVLEAGQDSAVAVIFNDMRVEMSAWNTVPGEPSIEAKNYSITFDVENGPLLSTFGLGVYNPFSWNGGYTAGRGFEIHLPGRKPTKLANSSLLGTGDDATNPSSNKFYVTAENLPWAINIPVSHFEYPKESAHITSAYLKFGDWVESGGTLFFDWYLNKSGYRRQQNIYQ